MSSYDTLFKNVFFVKKSRDGCFSVCTRRSLSAGLSGMAKQRLRVFGVHAGVSEGGYYCFMYQYKESATVI